MSETEEPGLTRRRLGSQLTGQTVHGGVLMSVSMAPLQARNMRGPDRNLTPAVDGYRHFPHALHARYTGPDRSLRQHLMRVCQTRREGGGSAKRCWRGSQDGQVPPELSLLFRLT